MENYVESFRETHVWDTNWKVLAENFMESYHLPVCHAATIGGLSKLDEMVCPPGLATFNYHTILKDDILKIALAHPSNTRLQGDRRRTTFLLAIYPSLLITLTPGYFWYLSLHPAGAGQVHIVFGGGMSPEFVDDPEAQAHFAALKTLLDEVNVEDRGCTEKVFRGVCRRRWRGPATSATSSARTTTSPAIWRAGWRAPDDGRGAGDPLGSDRAGARGGRFRGGGDAPAHLCRVASGRSRVPGVRRRGRGAARPLRAAGGCAARCARIRRGGGGVRGDAAARTERVDREHERTFGRDVQALCSLMLSRTYSVPGGKSGTNAS